MTTTVGETNPVEVPAESPEIPTLSHAQLERIVAAASLAQSRVSEMHLTRASAIERISAAAQLEMDEIQRWYQQETEADRNTIAFAEAQMEQFMRARLASAEKGDRKSVTTPYGTISSRIQQPEYVVSPGELIPWATKHGYMKPPKPAEPGLDWERLKKALTIEQDGSLTVEGETVPGVTIEKREPSVKVEIDSR